MANFLSRLFNEDARKLKQIQKKIKPVLELEEEYKAKSDDELKAVIEKFFEYRFECEFQEVDE